MSDGTEALLIRLTKLVRVPAMSQLVVRARSDGIGLWYLKPKPSISAKHGVRMTNGVAALDSRKELNVLTGNLQG